MPLTSAFSACLRTLGSSLANASTISSGTDISYLTSSVAGCFGCSVGSFAGVVSLAACCSATGFFSRKPATASRMLCSGSGPSPSVLAKAGSGSEEVGAALAVEAAPAAAPASPPPSRAGSSPSPPSWPSVAGGAKNVDGSKANVSRWPSSGGGGGAAPSVSGNRATLLSRYFFNIVWFLSHGLVNTLQGNIKSVDLSLRPNGSPNVLIRHHLPAQQSFR